MLRFLFLALSTCFLITLVSFWGCSNSDGNAAAEKQLRLIDNVLKRSDIPESMREILLKKKASGNEKIHKDEVDMMLHAAFKRDKNGVVSSAVKRGTSSNEPKTKMRIATKLGGGSGGLEAMLPTRSKTPFDSQPPVYRTEPAKAHHSFELWRKRRLESVKQFKTEDINLLTDADRATAVKIMEAIIGELGLPFNQDNWDAHAVEAARVERLSLGLKLDRAL